jgi:glycogen debranching enzyme
MKQSILFLLLVSTLVSASAQEPCITSFPITTGELTLTRLAQPNTPFNKVGRRFAILGTESGSFEAWAFPLKLFRNFEFSFLIGSSTKPILARDIVRYIQVTPEATTLTYCYQSFTMRATFVAAIDQPTAMILLDVDSVEPLSIVCAFLPVLQPMWPAGIGGQSAYWNQDLKAYQISEPTRNNTAYIGSPAAAGISYTPAHMLSDVPSEFKIEISDPKMVKDKFIPIFMAGARAPRDSVRSLYQRTCSRAREIYLQACLHYKNLQENTLRIKTPDKELNLAFAWSKICLDNLLTQNPDLGEGLIAGLGASGSSGRPGFGWFFGGDAYMNSLALCSYGALDATRTALAFTLKWQRQDGKMAHELSQAAGYIDWFKDYPYGYIHGDTTPFFIVAMYNYFINSADTVFVKRSWPALQKALDWCISVDENKDGLIDNRKAGLGSVEYGALTDLATDIYTGALSVRAFRDLESMAGVIGDNKYRSKSLKAKLEAERSFDDKFWSQEGQTFANAFNDNGEQIREVSPWISIPAILGVGDTLHNRQSMYRLSMADMTTDWGIRSISNTSGYFGALDYNYGAVWPFLSGFVTTAQFNCGLVQQAFVNMINISRLMFDNNLGSIIELYSGVHHIWPAEGVSQQGFSSTGVALAISRGWLGLEVDAVRKQVVFAPAMLPGYSELQVEQIKIGKTVLDIRVSREGDRYSFTISPTNGTGTSLVLSPRFGPACSIKRISVADGNCAYSVRKNAQTVQPILPIKLGSQPVTVQIDAFLPWEWVPAPAHSRIGDANNGLKIIDIRQEGGHGIVECQGRSGGEYDLGPQKFSHLTSVSRGSMIRQGDNWHLLVPESDTEEFITIQIVFD